MTTYSERLFKIYKVQGLNKFLSHPEFYINISLEKIYRFNPNVSIKCSRLAILDIVNNYIVKYVKENIPFSDKQLITKYCDFLYKLCLKYPTMVLIENILFNDDIYIYLFNENQIKVIKKLKDKLKQEIKEIIVKVNNNETLPKNVYKKYLFYLLNQIDNESKETAILVENCVGKLLESYHSNSLLEKELILKYAAYKTSIENHIPPVFLYFSDDHFNSKPYDKGTQGGTYENTGIITLNRNYVINCANLSDLTERIKTIAHETRHSAQAYEDSMGIISYISIEYARYKLFKKYLSKKDVNEYKINYYHSEIERDANIYGWDYTTRLLKKFNPNFIKDIENATINTLKNQYEQALDFKINGEDKQIKEDYNVHFIDEILISHPEELIKHPQLQVFYNPNGERKDVISLIETENELVEEENDIKLQKIFEEYYYADLINQLLTNLNLNDFNDEQKPKIISRLDKVLQIEAQYLYYTLDIINEKNKATFEHVNRIRIRVIMDLINYLNLYNNSNKQAYSFNKSFEIITKIKAKIETNKLLAQTAIYNELYSLSEVNRYGHKI